MGNVKEEVRICYDERKYFGNMKPDICYDKKNGWEPAD